MNLYHVQDTDRATFVVAESFSHAVTRWREQMQRENPAEDMAGHEPQGVTLVAEGTDIDKNPEVLLPRTTKHKGEDGGSSGERETGSEHRPRPAPSSSPAPKLEAAPNVGVRFGDDVLPYPTDKQIFEAVALLDAMNSHAEHGILNAVGAALECIKRAPAFVQVEAKAVHSGFFAQIPEPFLADALYRAARDRGMTADEAGELVLETGADAPFTIQPANGQAGERWYRRGDRRTIHAVLWADLDALAHEIGKALDRFAKGPVVFEAERNTVRARLLDRTQVLRHIADSASKLVVAGTDVSEGLAGTVDAPRR